MSFFVRNQGISVTKLHVDERVRIPVRELATTFRNAANEAARKSHANATIHRVSKFAVIGALASTVGALESLARCVWMAVKCYFSHSVQDARRFEGYRIARDNAKTLLGYHLANICTLGFLGYSISDNDQDLMLSSVHRGDEYGWKDLQDLREVEFSSFTGEEPYRADHSRDN